MSELSGQGENVAGRKCERDGCGNEFVPKRSDNRFCRAPDCKAARQKIRWQRWADKQTHEELRAKLNTYQQNFRSRTDYARDWELQKKYGITMQDWLDMLVRAGNACEICGDSDETTRLCVDHNHKTGKVRGVLCAKCNKGLGNLGDTIESLQKAIDYLRERDI